MNKNILLQRLTGWRCLSADLAYQSRDRETIDADLTRFLPEIPYQQAGIRALNYCLLFIPSFRSVFYYRIREHFILRGLSKIFVKAPPAIEIHGSIGKGFAVYHNSCVIHPHRAGQNFTVNYGVVIGKGKPAPDDPMRVDPDFGDNVEVFPNASIFGGITIGNNVKIGAGAVVNKDVPDNCTVVGNPMRIIHRD
jgi:serine O-acetyltransferase